MESRGSKWLSDSLASDERRPAGPVGPLPWGTKCRRRNKQAPSRGPNRQGPIHTFRRAFWQPGRPARGCPHAPACGSVVRGVTPAGRSARRPAHRREGRYLPPLAKMRNTPKGDLATAPCCRTPFAERSGRSPAAPLAGLTRFLRGFRNPLPQQRRLAEQVNESRFGRAPYRGRDWSYRPNPC